MKKLTTLICLFCPVFAFAGPKLYVFDCGVIAMADITMFNLSNDETDVRELFVPCYLVEHEKGRLFWDGGLPKPMADAPGEMMIAGGKVRYERWIIDQLADMGVGIGDIEFAAYSHLHFDHAGAANFLTESRVLMQRAEWDAAFNVENEFIDTSLVDQIPEENVQLLDGDYDVFGDGSVQIVYAPGHTPGHQTLLIDLENTGPVLLSGDLYHFRENRSLRRPPHFNFDREMTLKAMDKVEAVLKETGATLWIEHDQALADTLNKAPDFYD